jgi:hypothetical protein
MQSLEKMNTSIIPGIKKYQNCDVVEQEKPYLKDRD